MKLGIQGEISNASNPAPAASLAALECLIGKPEKCSAHASFKICAPHYLAACSTTLMALSMRSMSLPCAADTPMMEARNGHEEYALSQHLLLELYEALLASGGDSFYSLKQRFRSGERHLDVR